MCSNEGCRRVIPSGGVTDVTMALDARVAGRTRAEGRPSPYVRRIGGSISLPRRRDGWPQLDFTARDTLHRMTENGSASSAARSIRPTSAIWSRRSTSATRSPSTGCCWWWPTGRGRRSGTAPITPAADRLAMVEAAVAGVDGLEACADRDRPGRRQLHGRHAGRAAPTQPDADLHLVLGADAAAGLPTWERVDEVRALAIARRRRPSRVDAGVDPRRMAVDPRRGASARGVVDRPPGAGRATGVRSTTCCRAT